MLNYVCYRFVGVAISWPAVGYSRHYFLCCCPRLNLNYAETLLGPFQTSTMDLFMGVVGFYIFSKRELLEALSKDGRSPQEVRRFKSVLPILIFLNLTLISEYMKSNFKWLSGAILFRDISRFKPQSCPLIWHYGIA